MKLISEQKIQAYEFDYENGIKWRGILISEERNEYWQKTWFEKDDKKYFYQPKLCKMLEQENWYGKIEFFKTSHFRQTVGYPETFDDFDNVCYFNYGHDSLLWKINYDFPYPIVCKLDWTNKYKGDIDFIDDLYEELKINPYVLSIEKSYDEIELVIYYKLPLDIQESLWNEVKYSDFPSVNLEKALNLTKKKNLLGVKK